MEKIMDVAVLCGGYSSEREISLKSGKLVLEALKRFCMVYLVDISTDGWFVIIEDERHEINKADFTFSLHGKNISFDACYNTIHGHPGEDGLIAAYLELLKIPQTSCPHSVAALTFNKRDTLSIVKDYGIPIARNVMLDKGDPIDINSIVNVVGLPCFVKANRSGSSYGITKVYDAESIEDAIDFAFAEDDQVIIESFLEGTEISVGAYRNRDEIMVLPATEIISENDFFDYEAKYLGKSSEITPARITQLQYEQVKSYIETIYTKLGCAGIVRVDFIFHNDIPHFLEINTTPGMSAASLVPQQVRAAGKDLGLILYNIVEQSIDNFI